MQAATASRSSFAAGTAVARRAAGRRSAPAARRAVAVQALSGKVANKQLLEVAQQAAAAGAKVSWQAGVGSSELASRAAAA